MRINELGAKTIRPHRIKLSTETKALERTCYKKAWTVKYLINNLRYI